MDKDKQPAVDEDVDMPGDRLAEAVDGEMPPRLPFSVVGIGASAGGLEAFSEFFSTMPDDTGMAFVLIQHLPPQGESLLAEILSKRTVMPVAEVEDGMKVKPNHVYVIRPNRTLIIHKGCLHLTEPLTARGHRCPVDDFFRSLAEEQRERAIAVVLSGMGSNGSAGAESIKAVGGLCVAQDPDSAEFPSMPRSVVEAGLSDYILRPSEMAGALIQYVNHPYAKGGGALSAQEGGEAQVLKDILLTLRTRAKRDFEGYKTPTLLRRVQRRMGLKQLTQMQEYERLLSQDPGEATALADDMMIHVTGFFRDPEMWDVLQRDVILPMMSAPGKDSLRAWVTACSTGEEAFSLAMLLVEACESTGRMMDIKIFATDTTERSLAHARAGIYPSGIESAVSTTRLQRFFDRDSSTYRVRKELRELVVFAPQNLLQDAPFSRLDICTCRNLLIYLEPEAQRRVLSLMHFGLREGGVLVLGSSETTGGTEGWFHPLNTKHRIFKRLGSGRHGTVNLPLGVPLELAQSMDFAARKADPRVPVAHLAQAAILERFCPAAVVVDRQHSIVYFQGPTKHFLDHPRGEPTRDLLLLAHGHLRGALRGALHKAMSGNVSADASVSLGKTGGNMTRVEITAAPLEHRAPAVHFLVTFREVSELPSKLLPKDGGENIGLEERHAYEEEIARTRDELQSAIEELQTSNEEMKASGEEAMSINEELQSTNEEMETSKEELQSLNEELTTVNTQLQAKMEELEATTSDLSSLLSSTNIAVVFLDTHFRIRRYTPAVKDLLDLIPSDIGRPLSDLARKFTDETLVADAKKVLESLQSMDHEVLSDSHRSYIRRVLPYRTTDDRIDGVVITFIDITQLKSVEAALRQNEQRQRLILEGIKDYAIFMLDPAGRIATWNAAAEAVLGYKGSEAIGKLVTMLLPVEERGHTSATCNFDRAIAEGSVPEESWYMNKDGRTFWGGGVISAVTDDGGTIVGFVKVVRDNTDHKLSGEALMQAKRSAEIANDAKDHFLANVSHELRTPLSAILLWSRHLESCSPPSPEDVREGLRAIRWSAEQQVELIEDLMDTARIVAGELRLNRRPVSLVEIVDSAIKAMGHLAAQSGVILVQELDENIGTVNLDHHRLHQVISNLLNNALRYTPEGKTVKLTAQRQNNNVHIIVADEGQGISFDFLPRVFDRFDRADRSSIRGKSGLGLGLFITRQLVELHGGVITAHSDGPGKGAVFKIVLPLPAIGDATGGADVAPSREESLLQHMNILLVEDAPETRSALAVVLRNEKAEVTATGSAEAALTLVKAHQYDVIVSDIGLPGMDGYEFIQRVRQLEPPSSSSRTRAVALTAYTGPDDRDKALASGFDCWLPKPVDPGTLICTIADLFEDI